MWCPDCAVMDLDDLRKAVLAYQRAVNGVDKAKEAARRRVEKARSQADKARENVHKLMIQLATAGVRPVELQQITGYSAERVRQILREGGVEPY